MLHIHEGKCNTVLLSQTSISTRRINVEGGKHKGERKEETTDDMMSIQILYMLRKDMGDNEPLAIRLPINLVHPCALWQPEKGCMDSTHTHTPIRTYTQSHTLLYRIKVRKYKLTFVM